MIIPITFQNNSKDLGFILGPCQIESRDHCFMMAERLCEIMGNIGLRFVFKASYDKANRSSASSPRGVGIEEGLQILQDVKKKFGIPVLTDVHKETDVAAVAEVVDIIQVPAFLCRQTDLLQEVSKQAKKFDRTINIKKGQFISPNECRNILSKVDYNKVCLTERGTTFGYNNLVVDMRTIRIIKETCDNVPVIIDATHAVQLPGGLGDKSGGDRRFAEDIAVASASLGVAGVFMECHNDPDNALSDGANSIDLKDLGRIVSNLETANHYIGRFHK